MSKSVDEYIVALAKAQKKYTEDHMLEYKMGIKYMMTNKRQKMAKSSTSNHHKMLLTLSEAYQNMMIAETFCSVGYFQDIIPFYNISPAISTTTENRQQGSYGFVMVEKDNLLVQTTANQQFTRYYCIRIRKPVRFNSRKHD